MNWARMLSLVFATSAILPLFSSGHRSINDEVAVGIWFFLAAGLAKRFGSSARSIAQQERDHQAEQDYQKVKNGGSLEFALYLRPFRMDTRMIRKTVGAKLGIISYSYYTGNDQIYLEDMLRQVIGDYPVVGIGPSERGIGKIAAPESQWKEDVRLLATNAKLIFLIPFDSPGCLWELQLLRENQLLNKTVFIIPPRAFTKGSTVEEHTLKDWKRIQCYYSECCLQLPDLRDGKWEGTVVRFSQDGSIMKQAEYVLPAETGFGRRSLGAAIFTVGNEIMPHLAVYAPSSTQTQLPVRRYQAQVASYNR